MELCARQAPSIWATTWATPAGGVRAAALGGLWQLLVIGSRSRPGTRGSVDRSCRHAGDAWSFYPHLAQRLTDFDIKHNRSITLLVYGPEGIEVEVGVFVHTHMSAGPSPLRLDLVGKRWGYFEEEGRG